MYFLMVKQYRPFSIIFTIQSALSIFISFWIFITLYKIDSTEVLNVIQIFNNIPTPLIIIVWAGLVWLSFKQQRATKNADSNFYACSMLIAELLKIDINKKDFLLLENATKRSTNETNKQE